LRTDVGRDLGDSFGFEVTRIVALQHHAKGSRVHVRATVGAKAFAAFHIDVVVGTAMSGEPDVVAPLKTKHRLICLGGVGDYVTRCQAFLGIVCEQAIASVYADVLLASCSAVRGSGTYHQDQQIVAVKRAMIRSAPPRLLLLDSSKVGVGALYHLGEISGVPPGRDQRLHAPHHR
jgi:DeoR C terminal sensor domain